MGAQQMKLYNERLIQHTEQQEDLVLNKISNKALSPQTNVCIKTVMCKPSISTVPCPRQRIAVANFAKIKKETTYDDFESLTLGDKIKIEERNSHDRPKVYAEVKDIPVVATEVSCSEFGPVCLSLIEPKKELLAAQAESTEITVIQNEASLSLKPDANAARSTEGQYPFRFAVNEEEIYTENSQICLAFDKEKNKSKNLSQVSRSDDDVEVINSKPKNTKLVKNPLAFLKSSLKNQHQADCLNTTIKPGQIVIGEELENISTIEVKSELETINLNKLIIIKSEHVSTPETNEETLKHASLYQTCLSCNLDSSLDVNLSHDGTDLDEVASKRTHDGVETNTCLNATLESLKYFSTFEISSEEKNVTTFQNPDIKKIVKRRTKAKVYRSNIKKKYHPRDKQNIPNIRKQLKNRQQDNSLGRPKTNRFRKQKDYLYKTGFPKSVVLKNLPKTAIKTRKSTQNPIAKKTASLSKGEFPKPLKLKSEPSFQKDKKGLAELPQPMTFKCEFALSNKNKSHLKPELQPFVRLKRLKSEELLVPLRTKPARRKQKFKGTSETRPEFFIHRAYSLNPSIKHNRLSMDHDHQLFYHEQRLLNSRYATSNSVLTDMQNEMDSNYFSPQETYSCFQSATPDGSSIFSDPIDSGVSTSTPSTSHHSFNKSLLLKIAAERAFINNHLMYFGHSPIQFDLYNNLNELTIFLKFLLGNLKPN